LLADRDFLQIIRNNLFRDNFYSNLSPHGLWFSFTFYTSPRRVYVDA